MATVFADFNAQDESGRIRLSTRGSRESLQRTGAKAGDWVWLSDGELRAGGRIEQQHDELVARVAWETREDIPTPEELSDRRLLERALCDLRELMGRPEKDYRKVLTTLALAERALPPGAADNYRSRAAEAFGYPELALLAVEDALSKDPHRSSFRYTQLRLLRVVDLDRAVREAVGVEGDPMTPALVLVASAEIMDADARRTSGAAGRQKYEALVGFTERFDSAPERELVPAYTVCALHVIRGFAFLHLDRSDRAIVEFGRAIAATPDNPEAYAARGLSTYPSDSSVRDLEHAVALGSASYEPAYYLTHYHLSRGAMARARDTAETALKFDPPDRVKANLLEWLGIAEVMGGGDPDAAVHRLREALRLAPESAHLQRNLEVMQRLSKGEKARAADWQLVRDANANARDLRPAFTTAAAA